MCTVDVLKLLGSDRYKVLLAIIPPKPSRDGDEAREMLTQAGLPLFSSSIRRLAALAIV